jgi:hypothetical protein
MIFHLPSYILGVATGASGAALAPRLRPIALELFTGCYRVIDTVMLHVARSRESFSDLLAEAHARARQKLSGSRIAKAMEVHA